MLDDSDKQWIDERLEKLQERLEKLYVRRTYRSSNTPLGILTLYHQVESLRNRMNILEAETNELRNQLKAKNLIL